jgi:hypothetical protein
MLAGQWVSTEDARAIGAAPTIVTQVHQRLTAAGYAVEVGTREDAASRNAKQYRVKAGRRAPAQRSTRVAREDAGVTHPQLGATLTVRALALDERGALTVHLSNGHHAWTATITGHVG